MTSLGKNDLLISEARLPLGTNPENSEKRDLRRLGILALLFLFCCLFYYFGEIIDFFGWAAIRLSFFYSVHDIHRLLFLAPIIYAGYALNIRSMVIITILAIGACIPRAIFISPFPDPILRTLLFIIIAGTIGYLTFRLRSEIIRSRYLEGLLLKERDTLLYYLDNGNDGVMIVGPDHRIRFLNDRMVERFGKNEGQLCFQHLYGLNQPCKGTCRLQEIIGGAKAKWQRHVKDEEPFDILAIPYTDTDGTLCQLSIFKNITHRKGQGD